jgi:acyl carrier protein
LSADQYQGTLAEIWATLAALISEQLGVAPAKVTPAARIVQDLGAD